MWILILNPITDQAEISIPVARAETKEQLIALLEKEKVEPYKKAVYNSFCNKNDYIYTKYFKEGSLFEDFNPPANDACFVNVGTLDDWIQKTVEKWNNTIMSIPSI